jgi:hypothetical protein
VPAGHSYLSPQHTSPLLHCCCSSAVLMITSTAQNRRLQHWPQKRAESAILTAFTGAAVNPVIAAVQMITRALIGFSRPVFTDRMKMTHGMT